MGMLATRLTIRRQPIDDVSAELGLVRCQRQLVGGELHPIHIQMVAKKPASEAMRGYRDNTPCCGRESRF